MLEIRLLIELSKSQSMNRQTQNDNKLMKKVKKVREEIESKKNELFIFFMGSARSLRSKFGEMGGELHFLRHGCRVTSLTPAHLYMNFLLIWTDKRLQTDQQECGLSAAGWL